MSDAVIPVSNTRAPVQKNFRNGRGACFGIYGFTLIELLVVIAVIAILAAILFPVFASTKENARQSTCLSNLKQLTMAWQSYSDDSGGRACTSYYYAGTVWCQWDFKLDQSTMPPKARLGLLGPYTRNGKINGCPSFEPKDAEGNKISDRPFTGYAYNASYIGGDYLQNKPPCFVGQIRRPSRTVVFAEGGYGEPVCPQNYLRAPRSDPWMYVAGKVHFRHKGFANVAYADGHVRATNRKYLFDPSEPECGALSEDDSAYDLE